VAVQRERRALLSLGARHVGELAAELRALALETELVDLVAFPPRDVLLLLRVPTGRPDAGRVLRVRLSAHPDAPRFHLQAARSARPEGPPGPFFRRARDELAGSRLTKIEQPGADRIVRFEFAGTASGEPRSLLLELTGRHANLALLGRGERVLDVLVPPPEGGASAARLAAGSTWQPPSGARKVPAEEPALADLLAPSGLPPSAGESGEPRAPLSQLVETVLGARVDEALRERARKDLAQRLERKLSRARALEHGLVQRLAAVEDAERVRLDGELLKANFASWKRGASEVELPDVFADGSPPRRIALDPRRTPQQNVEQVFERYKKLARARASVESELSTCRARLGELEGMAARAANPACDPEALEREALERALLEPRQEPDARKRRAPEPRKPYRTFAGSRGSEIRVGRSARDNDELTLHHARGNDLWLHTADAPGSHVVLRLEKDAEPDPEELLDAAHLAVHFSPLRGAHKAAVHVARRKEVHKPRGSKPGLVALSGGKVLALRVQPQRVERLLDAARHRPPSPPGGGPSAPPSAPGSGRNARRSR